jgi:tetratricopeptide (TPR) repeat protein
MRPAIAAFGGVVALTTATQQLAAQSPEDVERFKRVVTAYQIADLTTARAILDTLVMRDSILRARGSKTGVALDNHGNIYVMRSDVQRKMADPSAVAELQRAAQLGDLTAQGRAQSLRPQPAIQLSAAAHAFVSRANVQRRLGNKRAALRDLDSALVLYPQLPAALLARGSLRLELGDRKGAREDLEKTLGLDFSRSYSPAAFFDRGMLRISLGDSTGGMADVRAAADMGWANAQRVLSGLRPVPLESLNTIYALERDSAAQVARQAALQQAQSAPPTPQSVSSKTLLLRDVAGQLRATAPWLVGLAALALLYVGLLATWLRLTPPSSVAGFDTQPGERQLWIGAPAQGVIFPHGIVWAVIGFLLGVTIAGAFLFTEIDVVTAGAWVVLLPGVPIVLVMAHLQFGRHIADARRRKLTTYALTNQRAIVSVGDDVQSFPIDALRSATLRENRDGTGTIFWSSVHRDLKLAMERAMAEGRAPGMMDVRAIVTGGIRGLGRFERIHDAGTLFAKIQSVAGAASEVEATAVTSHARAVGGTQRAQEKGRSSIRVRFERSAAATPLQTALFFGGLMMIGLVGAYFFGYRPVSEFVAVRDWLGVPCEIVSSSVATRTSRSRDSDGHTRTNTTHNVDVAFRYEHNGQRYTGTRYQLVPVSRSGIGAYSAIQLKVAALPVGLQSTCWVDPTDPENAVLDRSMTMGTWFGLIPLTFFAIGVAGLVGVVRKRVA